MRVIYPILMMLTGCLFRKQNQQQPTLWVQSINWNKPTTDLPLEGQAIDLIIIKTQQNIQISGSGPKLEIDIIKSHFIIINNYIEFDIVLNAKSVPGTITAEIKSKGTQTIQNQNISNALEKITSKVGKLISGALQKDYSSANGITVANYTVTEKKPARGSPQQVQVKKIANRYEQPEPPKQIEPKQADISSQVSDPAPPEPKPSETPEPKPAEIKPEGESETKSDDLPTAKSPEVSETKPEEVAKPVTISQRVDLLDPTNEIKPTETTNLLEEGGAAIKSTAEDILNTAKDAQKVTDNLIETAKTKGDDLEQEAQGDGYKGLLL